MAAYSSPSNMKFLHHDHVNAKTVRWPASAIEELAALLETEDREGYGASQHISLNDEVERIILAWRTKVCDWYYEFIDTYDFDREVAGVALNYFDRYLVHQTDDMLNRERYQLTAVACLYVAIKIHSCANDRNAAAKALARLYHGNHFQPNALVDMETDILQTLRWKVNPPTMHQFAMKYILLHPLGRISKRTNDTLYQATRYQVELTLYVPRLLEQFKPSVLTFAALMNASERLGPLALPPYINEQWLSIMPIVNITPSDVEAAQRALEEYFPKLPGMDQFDHYEEDEEEDSPGRRLGSASPTNVNFS